MKKLYAIYSGRGIWVELVEGKNVNTKRVLLLGKAEALDCAKNLAIKHKRKYWVVEVSVTPISIGYALK